MENRQPRLGSGGVTLIELLVSLTILSIIIVAVFGTLRIGSRAWERGEKDVDRLQRTRIISELLFKEIKSIFPYEVTPTELDKHRTYYAFKGKSDSLLFVSTVSFLDHQGLSLIEVEVRSDEGLMARERDALKVEEFGENALDGEEWMLLDPRVKEIRFKYYDLKDKEEEEGTWVESWNAKEKGGLPRAIQVVFTVDEEDGTTSERELTAPIMNGGKSLKQGGTGA